MQVLYDPVTVSAEPAALNVTGLLAGKAAEGKDAQVRRPALAKASAPFIGAGHEELALCVRSVDHAAFCLAAKGLFI